MELQKQAQIVQRIEQLYVLQYEKYLVMSSKGGFYYQREYNKEKKVPSLQRWMIVNHLRGKDTLGVFAGEYVSKFICFDVDTDSINESRHLTYRLVNVLMEEYNISAAHIHVSFSGSKGYHVEIFLSEAIDIKRLKQFYDNVLYVMEEPTSRIEFRPSKNGVKIPLGIHHKTKARCFYVDTLTLEPIPHLDHILTIHPMDMEDFKSLVFDSVPIFTLNERQSQDFDEVVRATNIRGKSFSQVERECEELLQMNRLKFPQTRNNVTHLLSIFLHSQGLKQAEAEDRILQFMGNTWQTHRDFFSSSTTWEYIQKEVQRITGNTYSKGYTLHGSRTEIKITKDEILHVLSMKGLHMKQLLFSLLVHSKKHSKKDGSFYMAYSTLTDMGNGENRSRLLKYIMGLEAAGKVEIVNRGDVNIPLSKANGKIMYHANVYRLLMMDTEENIKKEGKEHITLNVNEEAANFFNTVISLIPQQELKSIITRDEYFKKFHPYYKLSS